MSADLLRRVAARWPLFIAVAISLYSVLLLSNVYSSQSQLRSEKAWRIVAESKRHAADVADLIAERRNSAAELAESSEITNYFVNKSLGMSLRYGLNSNLYTIEERFRRQTEKTNLRGEPLFSRIVFYDENGQVLVDLAPTRGPLPLHTTPSGLSSLTFDLSSEQFVIRVPVVYKGVRSGLVAASGDVRQISRDLISSVVSASYTELLLTDSGRELPGMGSPIHVDEHVLGALAKLPEGVLSALDDVTVDKVAIGDHLAVRIKIADTGLSLVTVLTREAAYGQVSSPFFLYSASAFPLILLIAAVLFERVRRVGWALVQSEQRFRTIFDNVRDVIFIFDVASLTIIEANPRVLGLYGYEPDEVVGLTMEDISASDQSGSHQQWAEYVAEATSGTPQLFAWLARRKSAEAFWVEITIVRAVIGRHDRLLVVSHDITQLKSHEQALVEALEHQRTLNCQLEDAQSQLLQSEKMASIGQLAAGIAHEINNPIGYVNSNMVTLSGYVENLLKMLAAYQQDEDGLPPERRAELEKLRETLDIAYLSEDVGALLQESLGGLQRVRKIVTDLRDFSHVDEKQFERANLERGLDSTLNVVWNELKYKADVVKEYAGVPEVECLPSQLNQVFMNLLVNAVQSIAEHGQITVRTAFDEKNVWVEIQDTGSGISPEHMSKIFEPFFTTKPVGKGTGLGLSLAYGIVKKHSGRIEVNSEKGAGSRFRIVLPRSRSAHTTG